MGEDIDPLDLVKTQSMDAKKWAQSFMSTLKNNDVKIDEGLMISWFANAIMSCYDNLHNNKIRPLEKDLAKAYDLLKHGSTRYIMEGETL